VVTLTRRCKCGFVFRFAREPRRAVEVICPTCGRRQKMAPRPATKGGGDQSAKNPEVKVDAEA